MSIFELINDFCLFDEKWMNAKKIKKTTNISIFFSVNRLYFPEAHSLPQITTHLDSQFAYSNTINTVQFNQASRL